KEFFGKYPELLELVHDKTDEQLENLHRGGHDRVKIYNAYLRAVQHRGSPTVILAKTVKGYGMGANQARNATHQEKKLTDSGFAQSVKPYKIPVPAQQENPGTPYRPEPTSPQILYLQERRRALGGYLPCREVAK